MPSVLTVARPPARPREFDLQLAGSGPAGDIVAAGILKPLNAKLGQACFGVGAVGGRRSRASTFDAEMQRPAVLAQARDQSAGGALQRAGAAAEGDRQESRYAEEADDLALIG